VVRWHLRALAFTLLAMALPASSHAEGGLNQLSSWRYSESRDPVSDAIVRQAQTSTIAIRRNGVTEIARASVIVVCADEKPLLVFDWDAKVAAKAGLTVQYRFDGQIGSTVAARYVRRTRQTATQAVDVRRFLTDAARSDKLYIRVLSDQYGAVEAWFSARGGAELAAVLGGFCPSIAID
jgi:hypothetical protein